MSRVYFHSANGDKAALYGSERAYGAAFCKNIFTRSLGITDYIPDSEQEKWAKVLPPGCYVLRGMTSLTLSSWLQVSAETLPMNGESLDVFAMSLQTTVDTGNDQLKLLARIHGQCEIHAWISGNNRSWLADIIRVGLEKKIYRKNQGWEDVINLLLESDQTPIVLSYSVCGSFPDRSFDPSENESEDSDDWYDLPYSEQWDRCIVTLQEEYPLLEMTPENWEGYTFRHGINGYAYREYMNSL